MKIKILIFIFVFNKYSDGILNQPLAHNIESLSYNDIKYNELDEHALVTDDTVFPFVAAILLKSNFLSAGALIDSNWVLTAADSLYLLRESSRSLRIRLGSINYKKGGIVFPVKYIAIHPNFDDDQPSYDVALIRLPESVTFTPNLQPIALHSAGNLDDATHFIVPTWPNPKMSLDESEQKLQSMEMIKRRRLLSVTHLHLTDDDDCEESLTSIGVTNVETIMCLDTAVMNDPCSRDVGAPVVLNGLLLGIVSSWRPSSCNNYMPGSSFVTLVSSPTINTWIHATISGHKWESNQMQLNTSVLYGSTAYLTSTTQLPGNKKI